MTLDQYHLEWAADAVISADALDADARRVPMLHAKWWRFYTEERLSYRKLDFELQTLRHHKHEWFSGKMVDEERLALKWPPQPKLIRKREEIDRHVTADPDVMTLAMARAVLEETLHFLEDVIKSINKRGYDIKNAIDFLRFKMGT
jgi:hypothetical protein